MPLQPIESRRSRKQREVVYQNGIQSSVLKEISTPRPDGSIPLISFLENVNYSIMELYDFNSGISILEENEKRADTIKRSEMEELSKNNEKWKEDISNQIVTLESNSSNDLLEIKKDISNDLLEIKNRASKNKFMEIMKMENDISNRYFVIHSKIDQYMSETYKQIIGYKKPSIRSFSDNLKKLIETKVISFDELLEKTRVELKTNINEISKKLKDEYNKIIAELNEFNETMANEVLSSKEDENLYIEIRMKKESCFNTIFTDLKNKYKINQLSLQTLYVNLLSEISNSCSFIFGRIESLLQSGSMSDVQLILRVDEFSENLINESEDEIDFDLDIKMNNTNREEHEFDLFKQSKKTERTYKTL